MPTANTIRELLTAKKIPFEVLPHEATFSAATEAETLRASKSDVLKTVVLDTHAGHVVAVTLASRDLDMALVREAVADKHAHLATETEMSRDFPAFELGSMPPLPSLSKVPVYVDPEIMQHAVVIFGESPRESLRVKTEDLFGGEYVTVAPLASVSPGPS